MDRARYRTKIPTLDLPTEAMWEYACRAGTATATYAGDLTVSDGSDPVLGKIAWYAANSGGVTHPVGLKDPNAWGFYDMLGNVNEWCLDLYDANTPPGDGGGVAVDPPGVDDPTKNNIWYRVARGGCFLSEAGYCRSACRGNNYAGHVVDGSPHEDNVKRIGYRLCCDAMALR